MPSPKSPQSIPRKKTIVATTTQATALPKKRPGSTAPLVDPKRTNKEGPLLRPLKKETKALLDSLKKQAEHQKAQKTAELLTSPDLHPMEKFMFRHMEHLAKAFPDIIRSMPKFYQEDIMDGLMFLSQSDQAQEILEVLKRDLLADDKMRGHFFKSLATSFSDEIEKYVKTSDYDLENFDDLEDLTALRTFMISINLAAVNPDKQKVFVNLFLDAKYWPEIFSDQVNWIQIGSLLRKKYKEAEELGLKEPFKTFSYNGLRTIKQVLVAKGVNSTKEIANDGLDLIGIDYRFDTTEPEENISIVENFVGNPSHAAHLADFIQTHSEKFQAMGKNFPIFYLAIKDVLSGELDTTAISALRTNQELLNGMQLLRQFFKEYPDSQKVIIKEGEQLILEGLQNIASKENTLDWKKAQEELAQIISDTRDLQSNLLDLIFLQFETGALVDIAQGKGNPVLALQTLQKMPFINTLTQKLGDQKETPVLRQIFTSVAIESFTNIISRKFPQVEKSHLLKLFACQDLKDSIFNLLLSPQKLEQIVTIFQEEKISIDNYPQIVSRLRAVPELNTFLDEFLTLLKTKDGVTLKIDLLEIALMHLGKTNTAFQSPKGQEVLRKFRPRLARFIKTRKKFGSIIDYLSSTTGAKELQNISTGPSALPALYEAIRDIPELEKGLADLTAFVAKDPDTQMFLVLYLGETFPAIRPLQSFLETHECSRKAFAQLLNAPKDFQAFLEQIEALSQEENTLPQIAQSLKQLTNIPQIAQIVREIKKTLKTSPESLSPLKEQVAHLLTEATKKMLTETYEFFSFGNEGHKILEKALPLIRAFIKENARFSSTLFDLSTQPQGKTELHQVLDPNTPFLERLALVEKSKTMPTLLREIRVFLEHNLEVQALVVGSLFNGTRPFDAEVRDFFKRHPKNQKDLLAYLLNVGNIKTLITKFSFLLDSKEKKTEADLRSMHDRFQKMAQDKALAPLITPLLLDIQRNSSKWKDTIGFGVDTMLPVEALSQNMFPKLSARRKRQITHLRAQIVNRFKSFPDAQKALSEVLLKQKNMNQLLSIYEARENPMRMLELLDQNGAVSNLSMQVVKSVLESEEGRSLLSEMGVDALRAIPKIMKQEQKKASFLDKIYVLNRSRNVQDLLKYVRAKMENGAWRPIKRDLASAATSSALDVTKRKLDIQHPDWERLAFSLTGLVRQNPGLQDGTFRLASDLTFVGRALEFTEDKAPLPVVLNHPEIQSILNEFQSEFWGDRQSWDFLKHLLFEIGTSGEKNELSRSQKDALKEVFMEHLKPEVLNIQTILKAYEQKDDPQKVATTLGIPSASLTFAYLKGSFLGIFSSD